MIAERCLDLLHRVVSTGWGYDLCSFVTGSPFTKPKWRRFYQSCSGLVLDLGGGTGLVGELLPPNCSYVCLDIEMPKLQGLSASHGGRGLLADSRRIPVRSGVVDFLTCHAVTHHLTDEELDQVLLEAARVLKTGGQFLLADALWNPSRTPSRALWAMDRGSHPRTFEDLSRRLEQRFRVVKLSRFAFYHEYAAFRCVKAG